MGLPARAQLGLDGRWNVPARDATARLAMLVCRVLVLLRSLGRRGAAFDAVARLALVHRACGGGRDPRQELSGSQLNATLNYATQWMGKQGALYLLEVRCKAPDKVVWFLVDGQQCMRYKGPE